MNPPDRGANSQITRLKNKATMGEKANTHEPIKGFTLSFKNNLMASDIG
jgi:hypothetical protein